MKAQTYSLNLVRTELAFAGNVAYKIATNDSRVKGDVHLVSTVHVDQSNVPCCNMIQYSLAVKHASLISTYMYSLLTL